MKKGMKEMGMWGAIEILTIEWSVFWGVSAAKILRGEKVMRDE